MLVTIELKTGPRHTDVVTKADVQKNMAALSRAIEGKPQAQDFVLLMDTLSILDAIRQNLPD